MLTLKQLFSLIFVVIFFGCTVDSNDESFEMPKEDYTIALDDNNLSQEYIGVFGHNFNKSLHGSILIKRSKGGSEYLAVIKLVNGEKYNFYASEKTKGKLFFKGEEGAFEVNFTNPTNPKVYNVNVLNEDAGYIILQKKNNKALQIVVLGTYEETGNESNFYGNWDLICTYYYSPLGYIPTVTPYTAEHLIVSHKNNPTPFEDLIMEPYNDPAACYYSSLVVFSPHVLDNSGTFYSLTVHDQVSLLAGYNAFWEITYNENNSNTYTSDSCQTATSGTWSWNGKTGKIHFVTIQNL